tara:strand:- start:9753 stop:10037 length:285 start_codon:yes stop_codon:yes gene_type:complete
MEMNAEKVRQCLHHSLNTIKMIEELRDSMKAAWNSMEEVAKQCPQDDDCIKILRGDMLVCWNGMQDILKDVYTYRPEFLSLMIEGVNDEKLDKT